ncbi:DotD/TraH family lipoprotein [Piscirickettsia litoralis]|nr:DotD/TraH family lipoprotein [Piscirickettsia litoralis]
MKISWVVILSAVVAMVQGCSSQPTKVNMQSLENEQIKDNAEVQAALTRAVAQTSAALSSLSEIRRAQYPKQQVMPFANIHDSALNKNISINWYGPIGSIVKTIANVVGFDYQEFGKQPDLPILVNVNYQSTPALVALQNIELQANNKAAIKILPKQKIISLRYLTHD